MLASVLLYDVALQLLSNLLCVLAAIENQKGLNLQFEASVLKICHTEHVISEKGF